MRELKRLHQSLFFQLRQFPLLGQRGGGGQPRVGALEIVKALNPTDVTGLRVVAHGWEITRPRYALKV